MNYESRVLSSEFQNTLPALGYNPLSYCEPATTWPQHPKSCVIWVLWPSLKGWALPTRELNISEEQLPDFIRAKFPFYKVRVGQRGVTRPPGPRAQNSAGPLSSLQKLHATSRQMSWYDSGKGKVTSAINTVVKPPLIFFLTERTTWPSASLFCITGKRQAWALSS